MTTMTTTKPIPARIPITTPTIIPVFELPVGGTGVVVDVVESVVGGIVVGGGVVAVEGDMINRVTRVNCYQLTRHHEGHE